MRWFRCLSMGPVRSVYWVDFLGDVDSFPDDVPDPSGPCSLSALPIWQNPIFLPGSFSFGRWWTRNRSPFCRWLSRSSERGRPREQPSVHDCLCGEPVHRGKPLGDLYPRCIVLPHYYRFMGVWLGPSGFAVSLAALRDLCSALQVRQADLHRYFHALGAGVIEEVRVQRDKGFGFVRYSSHAEAALAIQLGNARILCGKPIKVLALPFLIRLQEP